IDLEQECDYPWDGHVNILVNPEIARRFTIKLRIPGWVSEKPLPGELYRFKDENSSTFTLKVNGENIDFDIDKGFAAITRHWCKGDLIELDFPMPIRRVFAHEKVEDNRNRVALVRGPLVYCAEWVDNGGRALDLVLPDDVKLDSEYRKDLLGGVTIVKGRTQNQIREHTELVCIPYYAWSHRGPGEMAVWLLREPGPDAR
ncbi:glycoside hydrolase family 127 protein, partial [bacterium]|nr:glycoside hydrolase family 127 protein [bacterium]